jgi:hypothetical protein
LGRYTSFRRSIKKWVRRSPELSDLERHASSFATCSEHYLRSEEGSKKKKRPEIVQIPGCYTELTPAKGYQASQDSAAKVACMSHILSILFRLRLTPSKHEPRRSTHRLLNPACDCSTYYVAYCRTAELTNIATPCERSADGGCSVMVV